MAETLRINVDNVVLEVNDNGETITLPLGDERFTKKLYAYVDAMQQNAKKIEESRSSGSIIDIIDADIGFHQSLRDEFDTVFGKGAYTKVYGEDILVGVEYILQFIDQIMPYIEKHNNKRVERLSKYSANRVGSSN